MSSPPVLSVSQVETFDPEQLGGCPRRWWFERVQGHRQDDSTATDDGHAGHALLKLYLTGGVLPKRARMLTAVRGAIAAGQLPRPGPHLQVEQRFSGQPHYTADGAWVPLDATRTLWLAGRPWEGFVDLRFRHRDGTVTVWDHKFSSDIHARALPAEKLIRTVQMPIYALDTLRQWPDARAVNLVHLYVSRRGVESFIRHQRVSAEQVLERVAELVPLVQQMDAVRAVTAQDDVPFNRTACHARTGCPHQFRCKAFKRRGTVMDLTDEEKRMFGMLGEERAVTVSGTGTTTTELRTESTAALTGDLKLDDIFEDMPKPSTPKPQPDPETCNGCNAVLTPENSSRLQNGGVKHIKCPAEKPSVSSKELQAMADELKGEADQARAVEQRLATKCPDCPHPAHAGKPCEGKRGRGRCQCGATMEQPQRPSVPAAPAFKLTEEDYQGAKRAEAAIREIERSNDKPQRPSVPAAPRFVTGADGEEYSARTGDPRADYGKPKQTAAELQALADEAARAADVDGDGAAVEEARQLQEAAEQAKQEEYAADLARTREAALTDARARISELEKQVRTANEILGDPELAPRMPWSGTLAVNVTVELGPATLAFLTGLVKR